MKSLLVVTHHHAKAWKGVSMRSPMSTNTWYSAGIRSVAAVKSMDANWTLFKDIFLIHLRDLSWSKVPSCLRRLKIRLHLWCTTLSKDCDSMSTIAITLVFPALSLRKKSLEWILCSSPFSRESWKASLRALTVSLLLSKGSATNKETKLISSQLLLKLLRSFKYWV